VSNKDLKQDALDNLADALTEDILNTPDDELLSEVAEDYGDPRALANKFDEILGRAEKQVSGTAQRSSVLDLLYRLLERLSTLFGSGPGRSGTQFQLFSVNRMVLACAAAAVLIALILATAVFRSVSEFDKRSEQLAALEKEQLARSDQLAAQEKELLARSDQLAAQEKELLARSAREQELPMAQASESPVSPTEMPAAQAPSATSEPESLCKITQSWRQQFVPEPPPQLICADSDLNFWHQLVTEIYEYKWRQLDTNGQKILRQGQLDWLRNMRLRCNAAFQVPVSGTEMARAMSCILQSNKKRVAVLSNN
jgi:hypothetical protein